MLYIQDNSSGVVDLATAFIELWALSKQLSSDKNKEVVLSRITDVMWWWQDISKWLWHIWQEVFESLFRKLIMRVAEISPASPTERHHPLRDFNHELMWTYATLMIFSMSLHYEWYPKDSELGLFRVLVSTCNRIEQNLPLYVK